MNKDQIFGLLRQLGVILMTYLVSTGKLTSEQASTIVNLAAEYGPALVGAALVAYGAWKKRDVAKVQQASKIEGVTVVVDPLAAPVPVVNAALAAPDAEMKLGKV